MYDDNEYLEFHGSHRRMNIKHAVYLVLAAIFATLFTAGLVVWAFGWIPAIICMVVFFGWVVIRWDEWLAG